MFIYYYFSCADVASEVIVGEEVTSSQEDNVVEEVNSQADNVVEEVNSQEHNEIVFEVVIKGSETETETEGNPKS